MALEARVCFDSQVKEMISDTFGDDNGVFGSLKEWEHLARAHNVSGMVYFVGENFYLRGDIRPEDNKFENKKYVTLESNHRPNILNTILKDFGLIQDLKEHVLRNNMHPNEYKLENGLTIIARSQKQERFIAHQLQTLGYHVRNAFGQEYQI